MERRLLRAITPVATLTLLAGHALGQNGSAEPALPESWVDSLDWRLIGPANMGGRIIDLAVYEADPSIFYAATASGGLLKTENNGTTFVHQFDDQDVVSIGDVDVFQGDPDIVWVGTGENNPRNSSSWGRGVYKSVDGGETWEKKGLEKTFTTGVVQIHPEDADTVYVGAMGRTWGPNEERGLYRTTDGGDTWEKILYVDENTGVIQLEMHPDDPDTMLVATWERQRDEFDTNDPKKRHGAGSGMWRTTDGGENWERVTDGLPSVALGRMDIDWSHADTDVVFAIVDSENIGKGIENAGFMGVRSRDAEPGAEITRVTDGSPAAEAGLEEGDVVISVGENRVLESDDLSKEIAVREVGAEMALEVMRDGEVMEMTVRLGEPEDPNEAPFATRLDGQVANVQDRQGAEGYENGGIYKSTNAGQSWQRINSLNDRPMYFSELAFDPSDHNYGFSAGVRLWKTEDGGETWTPDGHPGEVHVDHHAIWINPNDGEHVILGNDGGLYVTYDRGINWDHHNHFALGQFYHVNVDNQTLYNVYGGLQDNGTWGAPNRTTSGEGPYNADWFRVGGGDGFIVMIDRDDPELVYYSSQNGGMGRVHFGTGERAGLRPRPDSRDMSYRFNWKTPFMLSHHNTKVWYSAGNYVFRSLDRGSDAKRISPEIVRTRRGTSTAFDESPINPDHLMVGSDDGALWVSHDGGENWENIVFPYDETAFPEEEEQAEEAERPRRGSGRAGGGEGGAAQMIARLDRNRDGKIQRGEVPEPMRAFFPMLDTDDNGVLEGDELVAARQRMAQRRGGGAPARPEARAEARAEAQPEADPAAAERAELEKQIAEARARLAQMLESEAEAPSFDPGDPIVGVWNIELVGENAGAFSPTLVIERNDEGELELTFEGTGDPEEASSVEFDADAGTLKAVIEAAFGVLNVEASLQGAAMSGSLELEGGGFSADWGATREGAEGSAEPTGSPLSELIPGPRRVTSIEWSKFDEDRVYVCMAGYYYNDDNPYIFVSDDAGKSWSPLHNNLPIETTRVLREDLENEDLLYLGTEFKLYASLDRGETWTSLNSNLPTVAIHEIAQHETMGEIVAGTHGRSLWALDVTALRQMTGLARNSVAYLYEPNDVIRWTQTPSRGRGANRHFAGENPAFAADIFYSINGRVSNASLEIQDSAGRTVRRLELPGTDRGLHKVTWDLREEPPARREGQRFQPRGRLVDLGVYRVVMTAGDQTFNRGLTIHTDPNNEGVVFAVDEFNSELYAEEEDGAELEPRDR